MSADLTPALAAYRKRAVAFLDRQAPAFGYAARKGNALADDVVLARRWQAVKADNGFACITWPKEYGGGGGTELEQIIFVDEEARRGFPSPYMVISLSMPLPMMLRYATPEQKRRYIPPGVRGEEMWCQLFSEPSAGSDVGAFRLKAKRDGDDWVLSGQKVWTSYAQYCEFGVIVARTDPTVPKHKGLTYFFVDMRAPGVTVRPIRLLHGETDFNEVFFDEVRIPDSNRLGPVGEGFRLAVETLMMERYTAAADVSGFGPDLPQFLTLVENATLEGKPAIEDARIRRTVARNYTLQQGLHAIHQRALIELAAGREPGPEGSIHKLAAVRGRRDIADVALLLMGADGLKFDPHAKTKLDFTMSWLDVPTLRLAGGSDEMLLNTVAEKILGLPQDYRPDKGVPFDQVK